MAPVAIARSRVKLVMLTLGSLGFVALGVWMVTVADTHRGIPTPVIGIASIVFFGACAVFGIRSLLDRTPGMVLRADGFEDRSSGVAVGFVPWSDVRELAMFRMRGQRFIAVHVVNPAVYEARGSALQRAAHRATTRMCGTPITISTNALRISCDELMRLVTSFMAAANQPGTATATTLPSGSAK